jgi:hypothetical protein
MIKAESEKAKSRARGSLLKRMRAKGSLLRIKAKG